ncbi:hypothetical protein TNCT_318041 [Trichonephila clavata]|uniref:Uncharacterized protein n=1 Tax=Trichonephila clavata TaxID=2740835 RepID=A0A8X6JAA1_TRICU|nr:hypothetical protein TNCT_318041 [Trichonephila clavata]
MDKKRFIVNCRKSPEDRNGGEISNSEFENAEKILIRTVQRECFPEPKNVPIINVVKDNEGLLRVKITERKDDPCFLSPILLPENSKVLELLPGRDGNIRTLKLKCGNAEIIRPVQRLFPLEIQPEELPIADVGMEGVPEPSSLSEVPVAYTDEEVNPELTELTPSIDSCMFARYGRKIKPPQKLDLLNLTVFFES